MSNEIPYRRDVPDHRTIVNGIWSDILNAWLASFDGEGENSEVRVNVKNQEELLSDISEKFRDYYDVQTQILKQLMLLNARLESKLQTSISDEDLDHENRGW